jgi:NitT/TauT family transport system permease protein
VIVAAIRTALRSGRARHGALGIAVVLVAAELAVRTRLVDPNLIPAPSTVLARTGGLVANGEFLADVGATLSSWVYALLIAIALAIPLGMVLGTLPWAEATVRPVMEFLRPIPSVALIPLALLVMQDELASKVAVVVYASAWPVLVNTMYGVRGADPLSKETLRSFGFGPLSVLWRVSLPGAAPFIVTGIRIAASIGLVVAIAAELLGGAVNGVGIFIVQAESGGGHTDLMLAATVWAGLLGLAFNAAFVYLERRAFPWYHVRAREGT